MSNSTHRPRRITAFTRWMAAMLAIFVSTGLLAQSTLDTGSLRGRVTDSKGSPLPGAIIRAKGPQGTKGAESDAKGNYSIPFMSPGTYEVTTTLDGYSTQVTPGVSIAAQQASILPFKLADGTDTIVVTSSAGVDVTSTTSVTKINLQTAINNFAVGRDFTAAFDFAPGVNVYSGVEGGNPSVSGASGLENQYIIGGVNVTGSGFGTLGAYSNSYGAASASGISSEFFENLDLIEAGFDAQYGGALGGVFNATLRSGNNDWHGAVAFYTTPDSLRGELQINKNLVGGEDWNVGYDKNSLVLNMSGPIIKDKLFFFAGYSPNWEKITRRSVIPEDEIALNGVPLPNANRDYSTGFQRTDNYVLTIDWQMTEKHRLRFLTFGYPQSRSGIIRSGDYPYRVNARDGYGIPVQPTPMGIPDTLATDGARGNYSATNNSYKLEYTGTILPNLSAEVSYSMHSSSVKEKPDGALDQPGGSNSVMYYDRRYDLVYRAFSRNDQYIDKFVTAPINYIYGGLGDYIADNNDDNSSALVKFIYNFNALGAHELKFGAEWNRFRYFEDLRYSGSGPKVRLDVTNPNSETYIRSGVLALIYCYGATPAGSGPNGEAISFDEACPRIPYGPFANTGYRYRIAGGQISPAQGNTVNKEFNVFIQDNWQIKNVTLNIGFRYTTSKVFNPDRYTLLNTSGTPLIDKRGNAVGSRTLECVLTGSYASSCYPGGEGTFIGNSYDFHGELSPRIGVSWDVLGNGKSKLTFKYARLYERIPNNLLQRSFGNQFYSGDIRYTSPDLSTQDAVEAFSGGSTPTQIMPGTRLPYKDDFSLGYQFEVAPQFTIDIKANYRKQGRILEDTSNVPVEAYQNYFFNYYTNYPVYGNRCINGCSPGQTEFFPGQGSARSADYFLANMNENTPTYFIDETQCTDPNGPANGDLSTCAHRPINFGTVVNDYRALSVTLQKEPKEGEHLGLHATYRLSRVFGNYEGLFRSDNEQHDPNITSLFDHPLSHLTESMYYTNRLNTDTPHNLKVYVYYKDLFIKNLRAGFTFKWISGSLKTPLLGHPAYGSRGELPGENAITYDIDVTGDNYIDFSLLKDYTPVQRGSQGRNPDIATWDFNMGYKWDLGKSSMDFSIMVTNFFNNVMALKSDMNVENTTGLKNPNYRQPNKYLGPRQIQLGVKWSF